jgi:nicotinamidase-related amidase
MQLTFTLTREQLDRDPQGCAVWQRVDRVRALAGDTVALLISDLWDRHWSAGATARSAALAPRVDRLAAYLRDAGALIVHAPSDTAAFYANHPARRRLLAHAADAADAAGAEGAPRRDLPRLPLPIDDSDGGSDTAEPPGEVNRKVWTRQHEAVRIDPARDVIADDEGPLIRSYLRTRGIGLIIYAGVHTNMCVLHTRSFSLLPTLEAGWDCALAAAYTDAMYNPARPPYVSHEAGTRLVCDHIRKHFCPTIEGEVPQ